MSTTTAPTAADIAEVAEKAADIIATNGHHKGYLYDESQADDGTPLADCRVCAAGAINIAVYGQPTFPSSETSDAQLALELATVQALNDHLRLGTTTVPNWNDEPKRQKRQVIKAFRDTAASLREGQ